MVFFFFQPWQTAKFINLIYIKFKISKISVDFDLVFPSHAW